jgi:DNA-binding MarR family transcriptional regulator
MAGQEQAAGELHELLLRIAALLRSLAREAGLEPAQLQALDYLARCNRYSDTPAAVSDYLGATRGSVSQTLASLVERGLVERCADAADGRVVHLAPTAAGRRALARALPPESLADACAELGAARSARLAQELRALLAEIQRAGRGAAFGVCRSCAHFRREGAGRFRCGLTQEALSASDSEKLCREHRAAALAR